MKRDATNTPLIVGDLDDPHVQSVRAALISRDAPPLVLDIDTVMSAGLTVFEDRAVVSVDGEWIEPSRLRSGWLRRMHRAQWGLGVETGTVEALELGTWHSAYSWMLEDAEIQWVTSPRNLRKAEGKIDQWRAARQLGIDYPHTMLTTSAQAVRFEYQCEVIVKPLGSGQFLDGTQMKTVYAESMLPTDPRLENLGKAPFIVQEHIKAKRHWRVVTVGAQVWAGVLPVEPADPADWRRTAENHTSFEEQGDVKADIANGAIAIAGHFELGYSSQDWVETSEGRTVLLDVNPSGQWLFLPERVGKEVAMALADRIAGAI